MDIQQVNTQLLSIIMWQFLLYGILSLILLLLLCVQDSHQRFSAEFISGLVSGSKHWNYAMVSLAGFWVPLPPRT